MRDLMRLFNHNTSANAKVFEVAAKRNQNALSFVYGVGSTGHTRRSLHTFKGDKNDDHTRVYLA
jgi:hypothetical protein